MDQLLAKPNVSLLDHLLEVLERGEWFARRLGLAGRARSAALLACAFHDVGKATKSFQQRVRGRRGRTGPPHALASLPFVLIAERMLNDRLGCSLHSLPATAAVVSHHTPLHPFLYRDGGQAQYELDALEAIVHELYRALAERGVPLRFSQSDWKQAVELTRVPLEYLLHRPLQNGMSLAALFRILPPRLFASVKTVLHLADWTASAADTVSPAFFLQQGLLAEKVLTRHRQRLRQFQQRCRQLSGRALFLQAPTGTGKTEAALLWASGSERLLYLLPTQATSNAMYERLRALYGAERVGLAHAQAKFFLRQQQTEEEWTIDRWLYDRVFAKAITVATLDQYLLGHLRGAHWEERTTLARDAAIVVDEVHCYEPYTLGLLCGALRLEPPARLAVMSATLPRAVCDLLPKGHLVRAEQPLWQRRRHRIELEPSTLQTLLDSALSFARQQLRVLVVANTVRTAQTIYEHLHECHSPVLLLHGRFTPADRKRREAEVVHARSGTIVVATQVVEVSLDISFDVLLTELAPLDALVQRMGRVNRYGELPSGPGMVRVCTDRSTSTARPYESAVLERTLELLHELPPTPSDQELVEAVDALYAELAHTAVWRAEFDAGCEMVERVREDLGCFTIDLGDKASREWYASRRGVPDIPVLPERFYEEAHAASLAGESYRAREWLVPVPAWWLRAWPQLFRADSALRAIVTTLDYDPQTGLAQPSPERATEAAAVLID